MSTIATSLKLPEDLKARVDKLAARTGKTPHAFLLSAIEEQVTRSELAERFLQDAVAADLAMQASGKGYMAEDVHAYVAAKVAGGKARKPRLKSWRK